MSDFYTSFLLLLKLYIVPVPILRYTDENENDIEKTSRALHEADKKIYQVVHIFGQVAWYHALALDQDCQDCQLSELGSVSSPCFCRDKDTTTNSPVELHGCTTGRALIRCLPP